MLTSDELIKNISTTLIKTKVVKLSTIIQKQQFSIKDLIAITFHPDKNIAFRAAWILENLFLRKPENYITSLEYLISRITDVDNPSCKRHYAKILMHITAPKAPASIKQELTGIDLEPVVEQLFDWLIDPKILIAVKVFAAEALFNMRHRFDWIAEELANQVRFLMKDGTAAISREERRYFHDCSSKWQ